MATSSDELLARCTFPPPGTRIDCAFSGGADSTALIWLARLAGCEPVAHHVNHQIRDESVAEARQAVDNATRLGIAVVVHTIRVEPGPNLEARARAARFGVLPTPVATGHTADDQAETVLVRLLRGAGATGLGAMEATTTHPMLGLRRADTEAVCDELGIEPVDDPSNRSTDHWRNRIRNELLPLAAEITGRDPVPILTRTAELLRHDSEFLDALAAEIDPTDARAVAAGSPVIARRALRRWLTESGYPPDRAAIERVLDVARGQAIACELPGGRRVERHRQQLRIAPEQHGR